MDPVWIAVSVPALIALAVGAVKHLVEDSRTRTRMTNAERRLGRIERHLNGALEESEDDH